MKSLLELFLVVVMAPLFQTLTLIAQDPHINAPQWATDGSYFAYSQFVLATSVIQRVESDGSQPTLLTASGEFHLPALSPDGSQIAYVRPAGTAYSVHIMNADGSQDRPLLQVKYMPAPLLWAPDNSKILVWSAEVIVINADGSNRTVLAGREHDGNFAWSPDSTQIIFNNGGSWDIWVMEADGSNAHMLYDPEGFAESLAWSPDGSRIAFPSWLDRWVEEPWPGGQDHYERFYTIAFINADGSGYQELFPPEAIAIEGYGWSPDSTAITFGRAGEIYVVSVAGGEPTNLTNSHFHDTQPKWSPDGTRIAFTSDRDNPAELYSMGTEGSDLQRITRNGSNEQNVAWSPDSTFLLFRGEVPDRLALWGSTVGSSTVGSSTVGSSTVGSDMIPIALSGQFNLGTFAFAPKGQLIALTNNILSRGNFDLYVVNRDGSDLRRVLYGIYAIEYVWSPDGQYLAIATTSGIHIFNANSGEVTLLASPPLSAILGWMLTWSPDSQRIAFFHRDFHHNYLHTIRIDGSDLTPFTAFSNPAAVTWSPNSNTIAVLGTENDESATFLVDANSQRATKLLTLEHDIYFMQWSPDGNYISYSVSNAVGSDIPDTFLVHVKSGEVIVLEDSSHYNAWSADSRWFLTVLFDKITLHSPDGKKKHEIRIPHLNFATWAVDSYHISYTQRVVDSPTQEIAIYVMPFHH